jgi:hypothetical protein
MSRKSKGLSQRNWAIFFALILLVIIFYAVSVIKISDNLAQ